MAKRVLILGAGGFVGPWAAREFLKAGWAVTGSDLMPASPLPDSCIWETADLLQPEALTEMVRRVNPDAVLHLAGLSSVALSWQKPQLTMEINVVGTMNVLDAVRALPVLPRVLLVGSSEQYAAGDQPLREDSPLSAGNPYAVSKQAQEQYAFLCGRRWGLPVTCVRAFNHTGPGQRETFVIPAFVRQAADIARSGKPGVLRVGNLTVARDFSHVEDIVRAYRLILEAENPAPVYNVGSGRAWVLHDLLDFIIGLTGTEIRVETDPERFRPADLPVSCCDASLLRRDLGWEPRKTVLDAIREMYDLATGAGADQEGNTWRNPPL